MWIIKNYFFPFYKPLPLHFNYAFLFRCKKTCDLFCSCSIRNNLQIHRKELRLILKSSVYNGIQLSFPLNKFFCLEDTKIWILGNNSFSSRLFFFNWLWLWKRHEKTLYKKKTFLYFCFFVKTSYFCFCNYLI